MDIYPEIQTLRDAIKDLDPKLLSRIKESYYSVTDNLKVLADLLEKGDADLGGYSALLEEHFAVVEASDAFAKVHLGKEI